MQYQSTVSKYNPLSLFDAITRTVAPDSGVLLPERIPVMPRAIIATLPAMHLMDMAYCVAATLFGQDMELDTIRQIALKTYSHPIPLVRLDKSVSALELWHGPTGTVKDFSVEFMAGMLDHMVIRRGEKVKILATATSNLAKSIMHCYGNRPGYTCVLLVPRIGGGQSVVVPDGINNIKLVDVRGTEHQCRKLIVEALNDADLHSHEHLTAVSTQNICALLPQIIHFFYGYSRAITQGADPDQVVFSIPCGNMAGLTAAVLAKRMGLPIKRIVAAGNINFHLPQYLETGKYPASPLHHTQSHSINISHPVNLPRLLELYSNSPQAMAEEIQAVSYTDEEIADTVLTAECSMHYALDPHSACALRALSESLKPGERGIFLSTASPQSGNSTRHPKPRAANPIPPVYTALKQILINC